MKELFSLPLYADVLEEYGGSAGIEAEVRALGVDGIEAIWGGDDAVMQVSPDIVIGYHLIFYPDWLDFWRGDTASLLQKFGSREAYESFYQGADASALIRQYKADLDRAKALGASYVVYHVSDVSIGEGYTYHFLHSHEEVIDEAAALLNEVTRGEEYPFRILLENQWWPGFTFTDPHLTDRLLNAVDTAGKGLLLDTGHLMNANTALRTVPDGIAFIMDMIKAHGSLCKEIAGMHFHYSLSGEYVLSHTGAGGREVEIPDTDADYLTRFGRNYAHILRIDQHLPFETTEAERMFEVLSPSFLTHELHAGNAQERREAVRRQQRSIPALRARMHGQG